MDHEKIPFSTQVDRHVVAAVRATVAALQRRFGGEVTLSGFVTDALAEHVRKAEADHNDGEPFPTNDQQLLAGRRIQPDDQGGYR